MSHDHGRLLVLIRHAKAEGGGDGPDHERRLTSAGAAAAASAGRWLAEVVPELGSVWVSSAVRAQQTWAAAGAALAAPPAAHMDHALYVATPAEVLEKVTASDVRVQVVVGHNPTMEQVLATATGALRGMRPGAVAVVDLDAGLLVDFWQPRR